MLHLLIELKNKGNDSEYLNSRLLFAVFERSNNGKHLLSKYREQLFIVFKGIIETNKDWIEDFEKNPESNFSETQINMIYALDGFKRAVYFDFDKRFFIDKLLSDDILMKLKYIKYEILIHWFTSDFGFFREKYWDVVKQLQNEIDHEDFLFPFIFHRHKTFKFNENITYMCDILEHLTEEAHLNEYDYRNEIYVILCSKLLSLIIRRKEIRKLDKVMKLLQRALRYRKIRALIDDPELFKHIDAMGFAAFIKLYYLTQDNNDITGFDYFKLFENNLGDKKHFYDYIIDFFSSLNLGFQHNIELVKKELGDKVYEQIIKQHKDFVFEDFQYEPKKLLQLIKD